MREKIKNKQKEMGNNSQESSASLISIGTGMENKQREKHPSNSSSSTMLRVLLLLLVFGSTLIGRVISHEEKGEWSCESDLNIRVAAGFRPGLITLDGHADDWKDIDGFEFSLLPALDPDAENKYEAGKMTVKVKFCFL